MKITITDTRTGKKTVLSDPYGLEIRVDVADGGETLHGIVVQIVGGCLTIRGKQDDLRIIGGDANPYLVLGSEETPGITSEEKKR